MRLGARITLEGFEAALGSRALEVGDETVAKLQAARQVVAAAAAGEAPVYGLNTGLGANLGHRLRADEIAAFQHQLIAGRAVAVGALLPPEVGRAMLLARLIGAAQGVSGLSVPLFEHLCAVWRAGLSPGVPAHGSIGASDLTQNACWALAVLGEGQMHDGVAWRQADSAMAQAGLTPPALEPKDAMAMINHSALGVARAGLALARARMGLLMAREAAALSCRGFGANRDIFATEINALRSSPGQADMAAWFYDALGGVPPRRVQDPLSFRTLAPVLGAAQAAIDHAIAVWEAELNGSSDSPAVLHRDAMRSTPNFHAPALALALEQVSLALAMAAQGAVMRIQRLMDPALTDLPRYLSPRGGASAGLVPLQKTAAALLADIRRHAMPVVFDAHPVSEGVEDMAPMTAQAAAKLCEQMESFHLLTGVEALVAAQAVDLRGAQPCALHQVLRAEIQVLDADRALGADADRAVAALRRFVEDQS
ncbi:MAG: aromatic amino acid lyase [Pseudomonadota bacterium]